MPSKNDKVHIIPQDTWYKIIIAPQNFKLGKITVVMVFTVLMCKMTSQTIALVVGGGLIGTISSASRFFFY